MIFVNVDEVKLEFDFIETIRLVEESKQIRYAASELWLIPIAGPR